MQHCIVNGIDLAFSEQGSGPAILLIHGFPLDHCMWAGTIERLSGKYRVIAPDLRGFGRSGASGPVVTMRQMGDDLAALLDTLGLAGPVAIGGLSMGGYVAFQFHHDHRERVGRLILCDTRAAADTAEAAAARCETADRALREGLGFLADAMLPKLFATVTLQDQPERVEAVRRTIQGGRAEGVAAASRGMAQRADATGWLSDIQCPTLVLVGHDDAISPPAEMAAIARAIPQSQLVEIPHAGHLAPVEQPAAVSRAIDEFLQATATGTATGS